MCSGHYLRQWRYGNPYLGAEDRHHLPTEERFQKYLFPMPKEHGCVFWTGSTNKAGYGQLRFGKKLKLATHVALELNGQKVPKGMVCMHTCDNPLCVRFDHLKIGTHADNVNDKVKKNRHLYGEKSPLAKITEQQALEIKRSKLTQRDLAEIYKLDQSSISLIKSGKNWRHIKCC